VLTRVVEAYRSWKDAGSGGRCVETALRSDVVARFLFSVGVVVSGEGDDGNVGRGCVWRAACVESISTSTSESEDE